MSPHFSNLRETYAHHALEALLAYATTLAFFLYLRASEKYARRPELLRSHPVMSRLLTFKQSIATLEDLGVGEEDDEDDEDDSDLDGDVDIELSRKLRGISAEELQNLLADMEQLTSPDKTGSTPKVKKQKKSMAAVEEPPKKKRKTAVGSKSKAKLPEFDLEEPEFPTESMSSSRPSRSGDTDAYGEFTALQTADAMDKAAKKKSLRFHTSKIESASARRERARANAGGDDDLPWKERKKEQERRLRKEAEKTRGMGGEDLNNEEPEPVKEPVKKRRREEEGSDSDVGGAEGYYDLVQRKSREKKEKKKAEYEATVALTKYVKASSAVWHCILMICCLCLLQEEPHYRRYLRGTSLSLTGHPEEQGINSTPFEERAQSPCQEATALRVREKEWTRR